MNDNRLEAIKKLVMQRAADYCGMLDCVDDPVGLDCSYIEDGIKIEIKTSIEE